MPTYQVKAPDGNTYRIAGPEGATDDQVREQVLRQHPAAGRAPMSMADVGMGALTNAPASAVQFGKDFIQPFLHPIETATNIKNLGQGVLQKTGLISGEEQIPAVDAVGRHFAERYGGLENIKRTLATDPVGLAGDASMLLTGGGSAAGRVPGLIGRVGKVVGEAGRALDPLSAVGRVAKTAGSKVVAPLIGDIGTGTGAESVRRAAGAGYTGGRAGETFQENLRGTASMDDVVADARNAVRQMRQERGRIYRAEMQRVGADTQVLDFSKIDRAVRSTAGIQTFKGMPLSPSTHQIRGEIELAVAEWRNLDPRQFHTPAGLDALKKKIGDLRDSTQYGTPERLVADRVYQSIRSTIVKEFPRYGKIMKGYEEASKTIKELERTLSLNPNATVDTALRKLQSVLRNNVNTNYGKRKHLADLLVNAGAPHLMEALAGQAMKSRYFPHPTVFPE